MRRLWNRNRYTIGMVALLLCVTLPLLVAIIIGSQKCDDKGGKYVRGVVWFECVR